MKRLHQCGILGEHDDPCGHHYSTPPSQANSCVYSSDDPCGHHASQKHDAHLATLAVIIRHILWQLYFLVEDVLALAFIFGAFNLTSFEGDDVAANLLFDGSGHIAVLAKVDFRVPKHHTDFFTQLIGEDNRRVGVADGTCELTHGLTHQASLQADMGVAHFTLNFSTRCESGYRVDDDHINSVTTDKRIDNFQGLLTSIGLRD